MNKYYSYGKRKRVYADISRIAAAMYYYQERFASRREVVAGWGSKGRDTVESVPPFCGFRLGLLAAKGRKTVSAFSKGKMVFCYLLNPKACFVIARGFENSAVTFVTS